MYLGRMEAFDELRPQLTKVVQKFLDDNCESETWGSLDVYVGDNLAGLMSAAAMSVLAGVVDVQDYLKAEGHIKE